MGRVHWRLGWFRASRTPHPGPLPVEGRGGLFAAFSCINEHTGRFSLSPQRGEGRGEGCEQTKALALSKAFRHSLRDESYHPCPLLAPKHARATTPALALAARSPFRRLQVSPRALAGPIRFGFLL